MASSTLDIVRIISTFRSMQAHEVTVDVDVKVELVGGDRLKTQASSRGSLEILPNADKRLFMAELRVEGKAGSRTHTVAKVRARMRIHVPEHTDDTGIVKSAIW